MKRFAELLLYSCVLNKTVTLLTYPILLQDGSDVWYIVWNRFLAWNGYFGPRHSIDYGSQALYALVNAAKIKWDVASIAARDVTLASPNNMWLAVASALVHTYFIRKITYYQEATPDMLKDDVLIFLNNNNGISACHPEGATMYADILETLSRPSQTSHVICPSLQSLHKEKKEEPKIPNAVASLAVVHSTVGTPLAAVLLSPLLHNEPIIPSVIAMTVLSLFNIKPQPNPLSPLPLTLLYGTTVVEPYDGCVGHFAVSALRDALLLIRGDREKFTEGLIRAYTDVETKLLLETKDLLRDATRMAATHLIFDATNQEALLVALLGFSYLDLDKHAKELLKLNENNDFAWIHYALFIFAANPTLQTWEKSQRILKNYVRATNTKNLLFFAAWLKFELIARSHLRQTEGCLQALELISTGQRKYIEKLGTSEQIVIPICDKLKSISYIKSHKEEQLWPTASPIAFSHETAIRLLRSFLQAESDVFDQLLTDCEKNYDIILLLYKVIPPAKQQDEKVLKKLIEQCHDNVRLWDVLVERQNSSLYEQDCHVSTCYAYLSDIIIRHPLKLSVLSNGPIRPSIAALLHILHITKGSGFFDDDETSAENLLEQCLKQYPWCSTLHRLYEECRS